MHALVGSNNSGKSCVLRALDFLFNPNSKSINEESFWNKDTALEIRVEALFSDLNETEKNALSGCLRTDSTFYMARSAKVGIRGDEEDSDDGDNKIKIGQHYKKPIPGIDWLDESKITGKAIAEWWKNKDKLSVNGISFASEFSAETKKAPGVDEWKTQAKSFISSHASSIPMNDAWIDNPKGYANVLKGTLPFFILVPAVRDVTDEAKSAKSSPFGKLLSVIFDNVASDKKAKIESILADVSKQMNRVGGAERVPLISDTESSLNKLLHDLFDKCDLEIEFQAPTFETLLSTPKLYVDDGFRNSIENKGHGLQRAVIFTILRRYAEFMTTATKGKTRNFILAIEEPELYMHPQAQRTIRRVLRNIAESGNQVFFSTHSALLVNVEYFDEIIRLEKSQNRIDGVDKTESHAWQLTMTSMIDDIITRNPKLKGKVSERSMRDLYSNVYNPRRNEGFFASKVVLVEGNTEEYCLPVYADSITGYSFDPQNISVVECGGKSSMDRLYRIFNELHIPCYVLFDYDAGNPDTTIVDKSKELLNICGEPATEPSATFISDRVTCFKHTWETDLRLEIQNYNTITSQAQTELGNVGKPLIALFVARQLTKSTPSFVPPSIKLVLDKILAVQWSKSCLTQKPNSAEAVATVSS
jgi:predicted ATP-dependent endonuclease of OLD family